MTVGRILLAFAVLAAPALFADTEVTVEVRATAREQIAYARHLATEVPRGATAEAEQTALFRAITAYRAVEAHWPADFESIVAAGMGEADLWLLLRNPHAAAPILERLLPAVAHSDNEPAVYRRLAVVYHRMNRVADAEHAFTRAEASPALARHPLLAIQTLRDAALFYERTARPAESAKRYRQLSRFAHVDIRSRALAALDAVRASAKANDHRAAQDHFASAEKLVRASVSAHHDGSSQILEREIERLRKTMK